jgi:hypothetical protein
VTFGCCNNVSSFAADQIGNVIETDEHTGDFKDAVIPARFTKCSDF